MNLAVGKLLAQELRLYVNPVLIREDNVTVELQQRAQMANNMGADLFVSIHCNSSNNASARGMEVYVHPNASQAAVNLANIIYSRLETIGVPGRGVKRANFCVLRETSMPAVLIELAFISNPTEEKLLGSSEFQKKCAQAIADGILNYLGIERKKIVEISFADILFNGQLLDERAVLLYGKSYLPTRKIAGLCGLKVDWDGRVILSQ